MIVHDLTSNTLRDAQKSCRIIQECRKWKKNKRNKRYVLRKLFFASLYLSTFTFGGGYVIVTLLKEKFVDHYHWIDEEEMLDLVAIAQSFVQEPLQ